MTAKGTERVLFPLSTTMPGGESIIPFLSTQGDFLRGELNEPEERRLLRRDLFPVVSGPGTSTVTKLDHEYSWGTGS